ncbi:MAG: single-stranded DNA-binding protein [Erysipelotrichaceae bacterium]|nr:single-stranded DNA-binding protein [Erysipelotrichaceae bacterium]MBR5048403.1 single-stranded DNA-binding protein [Erysipelotrichaceae bacterium]
MFNQIFLVGRIDVLQADYGEDRMNGTIRLAVERPFPESNSEYLTDYFDVRVWRGMVETLKDSYRPGDLVGINGRIQNDGPAGQQLIIAEKITLIREATPSA